MIRFDNVTKIYHDTVYAVRDVSLSIDKGDLCFIVGPSGAGKTTLLKLIFGLEHPSRGTVSLFGRSLEGLGASSIQAIRRHTGFVFQDFRLIDDWTVYHNAAIILEILGKPAIYVRSRVWRMLKWVGLQHKVYERARNLSGGERQRLALVRAIIHTPDILLADEPVGSLDESMARYMMNMFLKLNKKGTTIVIASHRQDPLMDYAKVIRMERGALRGTHDPMIRLYYILKLIARGLRLRPWGSILTLVACWFALCQLSLVFLAVGVADRASTLPATSGAMVAYIDDGASQSQIEEIGKAIASREETSRVQFVSKEHGLEKMRTWLGSESPLVEDVDPEILPAAFEITLHREHADKAARFALEISRINGIHDVRYRKGLIGSIAGSFTEILVGASIIGAVVVVCLALVIFLSIRVGTVSRRQEIEVMKMLGATSFFIYAPYIIEGAAYGLIGSAASLFSTSVAFHYIHTHFPAFKTLMYPFTVYQVAGVVFFACFCSVGGALLAIQRSVDG